MAKIQPPKWAPNAHPTPTGWKNVATGELLISQPISQQKIDEYFEVPKPKKKKVKVLREAPVTTEEAEAELMQDQSILTEDDGLPSDVERN